tara:strand:+ start:1185 stop:1736 length:552 start_codon:yes stop_codon:yes gene_type:complete
MHSHKPFNMSDLFNNLNKQGFNLRIFFIFLFVNLFSIYPTSAQTQNSISAGSSNRLSISLSNTIGVKTEADGNSNLKINNEANLIIDPKSSVADSFGSSDSTGIKGVFVVSPNGSSFNLDGLVADNNYIFGEGTFFTSTMETVDNPDENIPIRGSASSSLFHDMTLTVDQTNSSFTQAFSSDL